MRIFLSVSAKQIDIAKVNSSVKSYFKKAKQYDGQQRNVLYLCKTLANRFVGRAGADFRKSYELMEDIISGTKVRDSDRTDHYENIDPSLRKIGDAAFKKMKNMISTTDINAANVDTLDTIYRLAMTCERIFHSVDAPADLTEFKKYKTLTDTLREVGISYEN